MSDRGSIRWEGNSGGIWAGPPHSRADFRARPSCSGLIQSRSEYLPGWRPHSFFVLGLQCTQEEELFAYGQSRFPLLQLVPVVFCPFAECLCE